MTNRLNIVQNKKCILAYLNDYRQNHLNIKGEKKAANPHSTFCHVLDKVLKGATSVIEMTMTFNLAFGLLKCSETVYIYKIKKIMNVISYMVSHVLYTFASVAKFLAESKNNVAIDKICIAINNNTKEYGNLLETCEIYCAQMTAVLKKPGQLKNVHFDEIEKSLQETLQTHGNLMSKNRPIAVLRQIQNDIKHYK